MTPFRRLPLVLALAALACSAQAQSLLALVEQARGYDAAWQSAKAQMDAAASRAEQARAGLLPSAGLSAGVSTARTEVSRPEINLTTPNRNVTLSASQPLYRPANRIGYAQGQRGIDVAQAQLDAATQDLLVRVSQGYFDVLAAQDTLAFVRAQKAAVEEQLAAAKRNFEVGTSTITDQREAQARYDIVVAQEIAAENDLHVKRLALDVLVGRTGTAPLPLAQPVQLPADAAGDVAEWVEKSQAQQPAVRQATVALDIAELETQKARTGHLPTVDLQAGYAINHYPKGTLTAQGLNQRNTTASVGVALNLPLFAGFAVQNRIQETLALEEKARADLEGARRAVAQGTRAAFFGVQSLRGQVKALEAAEASSQSALDANKLGYQVGVRINIDVLNAQSQLYQTKRDLAVARYNLLMGQLKLRQAAGTLALDDVQAINAFLAQ
ncbi:MAG: TolC family outer membrane protein [Comamonadaceae bacterium]|nr:TolC family outer membrane protein [Comamonadaceae bacterium]